MTGQRTGKRWSPQEMATAAQIWRRDVTLRYGDDKSAPMGVTERVCRHIAEVLSRSRDSVKMRLYVVGPSFGEGAAQPAAPKEAPPPRPVGAPKIAPTAEPSGVHWTTEEMATAAMTWEREFAIPYDDGATAPYGAQLRVLRHIALKLSRKVEAVQSRYQDHGPSFGGKYRRKLGEAPNMAVLDLEARRKAAQRQSLTGMVMGDPPPGFSALDRRRSQ